MRLKRNQVEQALAAVLRRNVDRDAAPDLRVRMKRLLETDRALGREIGSDDPERGSFAFYTDEAPGSGIEVWFSAYEVFALLVALRLLGHGWPRSGRSNSPELSGLRVGATDFSTSTAD